MASSDCTIRQCLSFMSIIWICCVLDLALSFLISGGVCCILSSLGTFIRLFLPWLIDPEIPLLPILCLLFLIYVQLNEHVDEEF